MKKNLMKLLVVMIMGMFLVPGSVSATTYTLQDILWESELDTVDISFDNLDHYGVYARSVSVTIEGFDQQYTAFCIEPGQPINVANNVNVEVELVSAGSVTGGLEAAWLLQNITNWDAEALQVAIWEIVEDNNTSHVYDLTSGNFQLLVSTEEDEETLALASSYLESLTQNFSADGLDAMFMASTNPTKQDLIYYGTIFGDSGDSKTPEPATMFLLGSGVLGLAGLRRKIRKS